MARRVIYECDKCGKEVKEAKTLVNIPVLRKCDFIEDEIDHTLQEGIYEIEVCLHCLIEITETVGLAK